MPCYCPCTCLTFKRNSRFIIYCVCGNELKNQNLLRLGLYKAEKQIKQAKSFLSKQIVFSNAICSWIKIKFCLYHQWCFCDFPRQMDWQHLGLASRLLIALENILRFSCGHHLVNLGLPNPNVLPKKLKFISSNAEIRCNTIEGKIPL